MEHAKLILCFSFVACFRNTSFYICARIVVSVLWVQPQVNKNKICHIWGNFTFHYHWVATYDIFIIGFRFITLYDNCMYQRIKAWKWREVKQKVNLNKMNGTVKAITRNDRKLRGILMVRKTWIQVYAQLRRKFWHSSKYHMLAKNCYAIIPHPLHRPRLRFVQNPLRMRVFYTSPPLHCLWSHTHSPLRLCKTEKRLLKQNWEILKCNLKETKSKYKRNYV